MKKFLLLCLIFFPCFCLFAESINLEQARIMALANSRSLAKISLSMRGSELDEKAHIFSMLPGVSLGYTASIDYLNKNWDFLNPADTFKAGVNLAITQNIFDGGKSFIQKSINSIATESVRKQALEEYYNVLDSVDNAYYAVLEAAATLESEESSLQTAKDSLAIAEIRQASGMINSGDYLKALADNESRTNSRNQARRNLALNETKLKSITGLTISLQPEEIDISGLEELIIYLGDISDEDADALYNRFWSILTASNPSLARSALNRQRAEKNLSIAKRDYTPTISASVFTSSLGYTAGDGFGTSSGGGITLKGSIPLDFWVMSNKIEKSKIAVDSASLDYISTEIQLETDLRSSLLKTFDYAGSVISSRRSFEYAEKHFEYVAERYRLSQSSISDLNEASTLLINNRNNYIKSHYGFLKSLSTLRSLGTIAEEERLLKIMMGDI